MVPWAEPALQAFCPSPGHLRPILSLWTPGDCPVQVSWPAVREQEPVQEPEQERVQEPVQERVQERVRVPVQERVRVQVQVQACVPG